MKPDYSDKWLATATYSEDVRDVAVLQLDTKTTSAIRRAVEAWQSAAATYGSHDVTLNVDENFTYWSMALPTVWSKQTVTHRWQVMETTELAALAFAGEDGDLDSLISASLLEQEVIVSRTSLRVHGTLHVSLEATPKYQSGELGTTELPKEVMDWIMG